MKMFPQLITCLLYTSDLYIYVGGQPEATTSTGETPGGFNGGGKGCSRTYNYSSYGQGGGGATDVRIGKNDLYARVIVAGGGGGSSSENSLTTKYGGGTTGGSSASGYGATQTAAGTNGSFGQDVYKRQYQVLSLIILLVLNLKVLLRKLLGGRLLLRL